MLKKVWITFFKHYEWIHNSLKTAQNYIMNNIVNDSFMQNIVNDSFAISQSAYLLSTLWKWKLFHKSTNVLSFWTV